MATNSLIDVARLNYFKTKQDAKNAETFVAKETGKSLLDDTEATRLLGMETGAQVNVIESISVNGTDLSVSSKAVAITVPTLVSELANDSNFQTGDDVQAAIKAQVTSAYKAGGTKTASLLTSALLVPANEGKVFNVSDSFTTTADFMEGADKTYPAGTNVAVVEASGASYEVTSDTTAQEGKTYYADANGTALDPQPEADADISGAGYYEEVPATYKFDVMAGFVDLSNYLQNSNVADNSDVDTLFANE